MKKITIVLRELRIKHRKTQVSMSICLNISQGQYNKIESGEKALDFDMLTRIAKIFYMSPQQLFTAIFEEEIPTRIYVINTNAEKEVTGINNDYKLVASYYEQKFLKVYRMYIELTATHNIPANTFLLETT